MFRTRIEETIAFALRDMRVPSGAFAASYDADSEGEEGRYYVWTEDEIRSLLPPPDADLICRTYGVTPSGNWEGKTILNRLGHPDSFNLDMEARLAPARAILLARRRKRVPPGFDDKVLADWNGLMIAALAEASLALARPHWAEAARQAFTAVLDHLWTDDRLHHSWRDGKTRHYATADGYANLIAAALALSAIFPGENYVGWAERIAAAMMEHHWDESRGAFCLSAADASIVIVRPAYGEDDATPNSNAMMIDNLVRLFHVTGDQSYLARAQAIVDAFGHAAASNPFACPSMLRAFAFLTDPVQIVMAGEAQEPYRDELFRTAVAALGPDCIIQWVSAGDRLPPGHPAYHKTTSNGSRLYLCRGQVCAAPAKTPDDVLEAVRLLGLDQRIGKP